MPRTIRSAGLQSFDEKGDDVAKGRCRSVGIEW